MTVRRVGWPARAGAWLLAAGALVASPTAAAPLPIVVDLDIGDDIDDSFALGFVLQSPELEVRGIGTVWGDTALRARMVERLLREIGRTGVPVRAGTPTESRTLFTQARWAAGPRLPGAAPAERSEAKAAPAAGAVAPAAASTDAVDQLLAEARRRPGTLTLLALGPLTNVAEALRRDPSASRLFRRVVLMGGSVRVGYAQPEHGKPAPPDREYNIAADVPAARALFASGVPIVMMPLDATVLKLDEVRRAELFAQGSTLTDALALMYEQWAHAPAPWVSPTPTLFDVVPVAWLLDPALCPTTPLRITIDDDGLTRETAGPPNAEVCLKADKAGVLDRMMRALLR